MNELRRPRLKNAKALFPPTPSTCCGAMVYDGKCCQCKQIAIQPLYFFSHAPIPDELAVQLERDIRAGAPKGIETLIWIEQ